ncbi:MAG: hypothetical protein CMH54_07400 [Myxococcales bacterium]|nr:hypothetical protein [Myxococcales bacterium]|tara:strand:+ start:1411 stop:2277 length:867 start_codon:yes stop_codon:yes gene_type:complete
MVSFGKGSKPTGYKTELGSSAPIVAVAAQKGGVGKTTTAVHLAVALAQSFHLRVFLIDLDAQGHVGAHLHRSTRVHTTRRLGSCLLERKADLKNLAVPTTISGLSITSPDKGLHQVEIQLNARIGKEFVIDRALKTAREDFDVVIIDCPPNLGNLTVGALLASDLVIVPSDMSQLAINGVSDILDTLEILEDTFQRRPELAGVLLCRVDRRSKSLNKAVRDRLEEIASGTVLDVEVPSQSAVSRAQISGTTVFETDPNGPAAAAYVELAKTIRDRIRVQPESVTRRSA